MSGETTSASPRRASNPPSPTSAGAWKHSDLPPPVGSTTTLSRDSRIACMASRCSGRKLENPQTRCNASSRRRSAWTPLPGSASDVGVLDVVIDQPLELRGELFRGSAQRLHMPAVDENGTCGRLSGARQADADVGGLGLTRPVDDTAHHCKRH